MWVIFGGGVGFSLILAGLLLWSKRHIVPAISKRLSGASGIGSVIRRTVTVRGSGKGSPESKGSAAQAAAVAPCSSGASEQQQQQLEELQLNVQRQLESAQRAQEELRDALIALSASRFAADWQGGSPGERV